MQQSRGRMSACFLPPVLLPTPIAQHSELSPEHALRHAPSDLASAVNILMNFLAAESCRTYLDGISPFFFKNPLTASSNSAGCSRQQACPDPGIVRCSAPFIF